MSKNIKIQSYDGREIQVSLYGENNREDAPNIVFVHGFKGFKDWGFFPYAAQYFADKGFFVVTFNFSLNGIGDNPLEFTEIEDFAKNTISREVKELELVIDNLKKGTFGKRTGKTGIIGHSRGGGVSLLYAGQESAKVDAITTWASVSSFMRYSERQINEWKEKGLLEVKNARTGQIMKMNYSYVEDILVNGSDKLNVLKAVEKITNPLLVIHGEQDLAVSVGEGKEIVAANSNKKVTAHYLSATGHTFDIVHPFETSTEKFNKVLELTLNHFENNLNNIGEK